MRDQYSLGGNPIFAVYNGTVHNGRRAVPGVNPSNASTEWNSTTIQFLQSNLNLSKAAPAAAAKHANRAMLGR